MRRGEERREEGEGEGERGGQRKAGAERASASRWRGVYCPLGHPHANWLRLRYGPLYDSDLIYVSSES